MIVSMQRTRVLGPLATLPDVLTALQDLACLHPAEGSLDARLRPVELDRRWRRRVAQLQAILDAVESVQASLVRHGSEAAADTNSEDDLLRFTRTARRLRRRLHRNESRRHELDDEGARLRLYRDLADAVPAARPGIHSFALVLEGPSRRAVAELERRLELTTGGEFELRSFPREDGRLVLLISVPVAATETVEAVTDAAGTRELPLPEEFGGESLVEALPALRRRWQEIDETRRDLDAELGDLATRHGAELRRARAYLHDRLATLEVLPLVRRTDCAFVLEGWVPARDLPRLAQDLTNRCGPQVVIEPLRGDHAETGDEPRDTAPVELSNPALFKPFEFLVRPFSLPRYGSLDPTPYVAVFLPMFFGLILGDVGYGLLLATLGLLLSSIFPEGSRLQMVGRIALACALFSVIFGYLFGEFFGNLGRRMGWMEPILFDREEAVVPFLILTLSLGFVHLLLGLVLGLVNAWRGERRRALGRGLTAVMLLLTATCLLALWRVIPREILTPAVVLLVIAFPVLVVIEGLAAPLEMLSTLGRVLSYARIMAIGTASVMLAVVANEMAGAFGSAVVGLVFALLFHLVNFALGLFSPTIHALRLHYVEFFGTFHTPGGDRYRPLGHWRPEDART